MERVFIVRKKTHEETVKGWKHALRLVNADGESLILLFESETDTEKFHIGDALTVRISTPQTTLSDVQKDQEG